MVHFSSAFVAIIASLLTTSVSAHPGHDISEEIAERAAFLSSNEYTSLDHCAEQLQARSAGLIARREAMVEHLRKKRGIVKRSFETVLNTDHHSTKVVTPDSSNEAIFGSNNSCILQAETTEGPYWVSGEYVRKDITDGNPGVPLTFDVQIIDTTTCNPVSQVALEAWHCNSTGVYGGVVAGGNGNSADASNINNTMFRGIQFSDEDGVLQFDTTFPGHYAGRTTHIHVLAHIDATLNSKNSTLTGGHVSHVGQLFFDQALITKAETVEPYLSNKQSLMLNANDGIFAQEAATSDPVLNYVWLGNAVSDGIFGWITIGLNPNAVTTPSAAAYLAADGGHANAGSGGGGGARPSGAPPSVR